MALIHANIIAKPLLAHGFHQLTLANDAFIDAQPGNYILLENKQICYVMNQQNTHADFIIPPDCSIDLNQNTLTISTLQGETIAPPVSGVFYLFTANIETLAACIFYLKKYKREFHGLVILEANGPFPFYPAPSRKMIPSLPSDVIASLPLLEDWGISNRLANRQDTPGCFYGTAEQLATFWLKQSDMNCKRITLT